MEEVKPYGNEPSAERAAFIQEAAQTMDGIWQRIRATKQIPLAELRQRIVPVIRESVEELQLLELLALLQAKTNYWSRHSVAVGVLSLLIGKWLRLPEPELLQVTTAAILHDVGKSQIHTDLLDKPGPLTPDEFDTMKRHTLIGFDMIKKTFGTSHRQALVALQHHERMDGSGYPLGLGGDKIDPFSRIVAVADVFHAMASKTVYRNPSPLYEVLLQMEGGAYGAFDPEIVSLLISKFMQALIGYEVRLTDGTSAKIVLIHPHDKTRPLVQAEERFIDLSKDYSLQIEQVYASREDTEMETPF
ncbi:HD-GYP domain-containing protein [Paenibacillus ginsengarvi]|uniref:HD-GYP domain-containing protein n=1 Tax=Paenibacillus ginsengarvi TaxID=400777 RepID=A0A3B0CKL0_9BACL|nr:HD-GYP domain-containing protein [Paenibacillus ginsengarvi]RKN85074.1 HD-GYP domain-containing protein [Paenibacillus ginsengarvi]